MRTLKVLAAAGTIAVLAGGTALAQQRTTPQGTNANGPITIFKNMMAEPDGIVVRINGKEVDHLKNVGYDDITGTIKPGTNTMTVTWNAPVQQLHFKIDYEPTRNDFHNIVVVNENQSSTAALKQAGSQSWTFTIPG
ncbi:MAG TPA: hypothetical protein VFB22_10265 [Candidatus Baltobacteraceae bacterium]|nr:hypothetical protein [Candidatus Baltobacteraceae bacterium]